MSELFSLNSEHGLYRVADNAMVPEVERGDMVLVERVGDWGEVGVCAMVLAQHGEATVLRRQLQPGFPDDESVYLSPLMTTDDYPLIPRAETQVLGVVTALIRKYE